nr:phospholipase-like protein [Tanacetum cinerariifolium]
MIEDEEHFTALYDEESIRVCLLLSLEVIFMGHELGYAVDDVFLRMVDNLEAWNFFPWGEHIWRELYTAIRNVNLNFVSSYSLSGFVLCFKIWILKSSSVTDHWEKDREAWSGTQSSSKEVSLQTRVKDLEGLCNSLMILPKEIKSLKTRVYKLVTIINVITPKTKTTNVKHKVNIAGTKDKVESVGKQCDLGDKYAFDDLVDADDCVKAETQEAKQRRLRLQLMLEEENSMKTIDRSNSARMKLALEKCRTTKRRYVNVLKTLIEVDTEIKGPSMDTLKNQKNVLDAYMIERCQDLKPWKKDLNRPFKCINKIYCDYYLEQYLCSSRWRHCMFPWCNDVVVDRPFWDSLIGLDDNLLDEIYPLAWRDVEQFHIKSGNITFYDSQETFDVEIRPWYVKIKRCLESKLPAVLYETGVFISKGIDPTHYNIKFRHAQTFPKQGGDIAKDAKLIRIEDQLLVLIKSQEETSLMLEEKFRDLCEEEVSNIVKESEDVVKEVERLSSKDVAKETVRLLRRGQKHDLYTMTLRILILTTTTSGGPSQKLKPRTQDRGCGYFMWKDDLIRRLSFSLGPSTPPRSSLGPSTRPSYSPLRSILNLKKAECSNCNFLAEKINVLETKIKILEGTLEMERDPENHTHESAAIFHELYNDIGKLSLD